MKDKIQKLKQLAETNSVAREVFKMFAERERTRFVITLQTLKARMDSLGVKGDKQAYSAILKELAALGIGELKTARNGRVKALDNITVRLQSIGRVALGQDETLKNQTQSRRYKDLDVVAETEKLHTIDFQETKAKKVATELANMKASIVSAPRVRAAAYPAFLTVIMEGRPVNFQLPTELKQDNLGEFLVKFKKLAKEVDL